MGRGPLGPKRPGARGGQRGISGKGPGQNQKGPLGNIGPGGKKWRRNPWGAENNQGAARGPGPPKGPQKGIGKKGGGKKKKEGGPHKPGGREEDKAGKIARFKICEGGGGGGRPGLGERKGVRGGTPRGI